MAKHTHAQAPAQATGIGVVDHRAVALHVAIGAEIDMAQLQLRLHVQRAGAALPHVEGVAGLQRHTGHARIVVLRRQADALHPVIEAAVLQVRIHVRALRAVSRLQPGAVHTHRAATHPPLGAVAGQIGHCTAVSTPRAQHHAERCIASANQVTADLQHRGVAVDRQLTADRAEVHLLPAHTRPRGTAFIQRYGPDAVVHTMGKHVDGC